MTMSIIVKPFSLIVSVGAGSPAGEPAFWRALGPGTIADARGIGFGFEFWAWRRQGPARGRTGNWVWFAFWLGQGAAEEFRILDRD